MNYHLTAVIWEEVGVYVSKCPDIHNKTIRVLAGRVFKNPEITRILPEQDHCFSFANSRAAELMQYLRPVLVGSSLKT